MHQPLPCNATALRQASRRVSGLFDGSLATVGLRTTQYAILAELERQAKSPPSLGDLAAAMVMDRSSLGHALRPLERDGLVALVQDPADRRRRTTALTAAGQTKLGEARPAWRAAQDRYDALYGAAQAAGMRGQLLAIARDERLGAL